MNGKNAKKIRKEINKQQNELYAQCFYESFDYWNRFYTSLSFWTKIKMAFKKNPYKGL